MASGCDSEVGLQLGLGRDLADHLLAEEAKTKEKKEKECFHLLVDCFNGSQVLLTFLLLMLNGLLLLGR